MVPSLLTRRDQGGRFHAGDLFDDDAGGDGVRPGRRIPRHVDGVEAGGHQRRGLPAEAGVLVDVGGVRAILAERADRGPQLLVLLGQLEQIEDGSPAITASLVY